MGLADIGVRGEIEYVGADEMRMRELLRADLGNERVIKRSGQDLAPDEIEVELLALAPAGNDREIERHRPGRNTVEHGGELRQTGYPLLHGIIVALAAARRGLQIGIGELGQGLR